MKANKLHICIIENLKARHERLWFALNDVYPEKVAVIVPNHDKPCTTWKDASRIITGLPDHAEVVVLADLALEENDINDARTGVEECRRLHQTRPDAKFIATTSFESILDEYPKAKETFSMVLLKKDPIWDKPENELAAFLQEKVETVRSGKPLKGDSETPADAPLVASTLKKLVFVSHCHEDADLAKAVVELVCAALHLQIENFRCTSLQGASLPGGTRTDDQLRSEISEMPGFISLLTPTALKRFYVLFELGARWGLKGSHIPLLARGAKASFLKDPLKATIALDLSAQEQVLSLVNDLGVCLGKTVNSADTYLDKVKKVSRLARKRRSRKGSAHK
jgi:hypothetical protein